MIGAALRRRLLVYGWLAALNFRSKTTYNIWAIVTVFTNALSLFILIAFWQAVYGGRTTLDGIQLHTMLTYIVLARFTSVFVENDTIMTFGRLLTCGDLTIELLRPVDFQTHQFVQSIGGWAVNLTLRGIVALIALASFTPSFSNDPFSYLGAFIVLALGAVTTFLFDFSFACLVFYITNAWGLKILRDGVVAFVSGALLPLNLMPNPVQVICRLFPYAQAVYEPTALLTGVIPSGALPWIIFQQLIWAIGLLLFSRFFFKYALVRASIQGG